MATKKGICKNVFNCEKADANEIIELDEFQDFVCPVCKQPLEEVGGAKGGAAAGSNNGGGLKKILMIAIPVVLIGGGVGAYFATAGGDKEAVEAPIVEAPAVEQTPTDTTTAVVATPEPEAVAPEAETKDEPKAAPQAKSNKLNLGYATYEGDISNGKAHGNGVMTFTRTQVVPGAKDNIEAQAGEYAVGVWRNGEVNLVTLYQKNGNQIKIMHK